MLYCVEVYGKKLQEIQNIISEFVTVVKVTKNVMTKMAFHRFKNVWTQCYQNTHFILKNNLSRWKATKNTLQWTKIYVHIGSKGSEKNDDDRLYVYM